MILEWTCFFLLLATIAALAWMLVASARLSAKANDLEYAAKRPSIPFGERADFKYLDLERFLL